MMEDSEKGPDDPGEYKVIETTEKSKHRKQTKPRGRPKIGKRKQLSVKKNRGRIQTLKVNTVGIGELAECVFSDDEMRADFLEEHIPEIEEDSLNVEDDMSMESHESGGMSTSSYDSVAMSPASPTEVTSNVIMAHTAGNDESASNQSHSSVPESSVEESRYSLDSVQSSSMRSTAGEEDEGTGTSMSVVLNLSGSERVMQHPKKSKELQLLDDAFSSPSPDESSTECSPSVELIEAGLIKMREILLSSWVPVADKKGFHILYLSSGQDKSVQREIFINYNGKITIKIHCVHIVEEKIFLSEPVPPFLAENLEKYCQNCLCVVKFIMRFNVCVGANHVDTRSVWGMIQNAYIDSNPYLEGHYSETCRSLSCLRVVEVGKRIRCSACALVLNSLKLRKKSLLSDSVHLNTANIYLTKEQSDQKLQLLHKEVRKKSKQVYYYRNKVQSLLESEGVDVDDNLSEDLSEILSKCKNVSPLQKTFLEEQIKCSEKNDARSHKWHPAMIRLALRLKMISSAAYEAVRDSGAIKLPSSRTLFDYSTAITPQEGVSDGLIKMISDKVSNLENEYQKYHCLLCDEMHVSQNLVYRLSDGYLVGYAYLDEVDKEWQKYENFCSGKEDGETQFSMATSVLAYMVKGLTPDVKCVVAAFPCQKLTRDMLYARSWQVIFRLEKADIRVLAFVCDGHTVNRAFIQMHKPLTNTASGVVLDTLNIASPDERPLYFISDVCHLLKTTRNAFYNSGDSEKRPRCLQCNGEKIVWKSIVRLYYTFKTHNFRKSFKLNSQNVFPNSFSSMKVRFAAQVLSATVANDIEDQNWPNHSETVRFIRQFNKFFDCLNGAFSTQSGRTRNADLAPYCSPDDSRFEWLKSFLEYLNEWKQQATALPLPPPLQGKTMLPQQTADGLEMSVRSFTCATRYLLGKGAKFIMARVFSQDPLEQHFSLQRGGRGGSRNPNVSQFLSKQVSVGLQRELGMSTKRGNVHDSSAAEADASEERLPKRSLKQTKKHNL